MSWSTVEYDVIEARELADLIKAVNKRMRTKGQRWVPQGGVKLVCVEGDDYWYQAVVRQE